MTYVVTFRDFRPLEREDGIPWNRVVVEESESNDGPFDIIDTIPIDPVDLDPAHPAERSFTTDEATLLHGWYRLTFFDAAGAQELPIDPIHNTVDERKNFLPTVAKVGALLRSRTKELGTARELGTFTQRTRPTDDQVLDLIDIAADDVIAAIDTAVPESVWHQVESTISYRAAMLVEASYFPEQVGTDRSAYQQYKDLYDDAISTPDAKGNPRGYLMIAIHNALRGDAEVVYGARKPKTNFPAQRPLTW